MLEELGIASGPARRNATRSLFALNFLRVAVFLAAKVGGIGAILIASSFWASTKVSVGDAVRGCGLSDWFWSGSYGPS